MSVAEPFGQDWNGRMRRLGHPHSVGILGIVLSVFAFWLALPPWTVRTTGVPIAFAILGAVAGVWALSRGERRVGG